VCGGESPFDLTAGVNRIAGEVLSGGGIDGDERHVQLSESAARGRLAATLNRFDGYGLGGPMTS
jgi:hypothetical protein